MTTTQYNVYAGLTPARVVAVANQTGTYYNGPANNGVGATFTYATGTLTLDSVLVVAGDRVLLSAQTSGFQNGIYICTQTGATGVSAILQRSADFQNIEQMHLGQYVSLSAGTIYGGAMFAMIEPFPAQIGVSNINFATITAAASSLYLAIANNLSDVASVPTSLLSLGLGPTVINYATVAITAAQFNGMYAAPKLLVAAPGANKIIVLDKVQLLMTYVAANYAAGGVAAVQYDSTANGAGVIASTTLSAATFQAAASTGFNFNAGVVAETFSTCVNKGLYLSNVTGAFTTGDSTFVAHVWYKIIPTT